MMTRPFKSPNLDKSILFSLLKASEVKGITLHKSLLIAIRNLIMNEGISGGQRLPSTRALAKEVKLSRETIENVYSQLESEGYVVRKVGSGTYVSGDIQPRLISKTPTKKKELTENLFNVLSKRGHQLFLNGGVKDQNYIRTFIPGVPEVRDFPNEKWRQISISLLKKQNNNLLIHGDPQGYGPLQESISKYITSFRGVNCSADQVIILTSSQQALSLISSVLLDAGDTIYMEDPGYHGARSAFEFQGLKIKPISVDSEGVVVDQIVNNPIVSKICYTTPSHQYPTGVTMSIKRRIELIQWAQKNNGWIIEDDYDSEFHFEGQAMSAIQSLDNMQRTIYLGTFSKSLFPSIRIGYMVLPKSLVKPFVIARTLIDGHSSTLNQAILAEFINEGHFASHVRRMKSLYEARRDTMAHYLTKYLSDFCYFAIPRGGMQIATYLNQPFNEADTVAEALKRDVELSTISRLFMNSKQSQGWLLGYSAYTPNEIENGILKLRDVMNLCQLASSESISI